MSSRREWRSRRRRAASCTVVSPIAIPRKVVIIDNRLLTTCIHTRVRFCEKFEFPPRRRDPSPSPFRGNTAGPTVITPTEGLTFRIFGDPVGGGSSLDTRPACCSLLIFNLTACALTAYAVSASRHSTHRAADSRRGTSTRVVHRVNFSPVPTPRKLKFASHSEANPSPSGTNTLICKSTHNPTRSSSGREGSRIAACVSDSPERRNRFR